MGGAWPQRRYRAPSATLRASTSLTDSAYETTTSRTRRCQPALALHVLNLRDALRAALYIALGCRITARRLALRV